MNDQRTFKTVGCFKKCDDCVSNFPELLFIDSGQTEHYGDSLQEYTEQFIRRCAQQSQLRGFDYFGITNYGRVENKHFSAVCSLRNVSCFIVVIKNRRGYWMGHSTT